VLGLTWLAGLLRRRSARLAGQALGVTLAVAMFASLGTFFASSRAQMTSRAVAAVPVDWQVRLSPGADPAKALAAVAGAPGVTVAEPVGFADTGGFRTSAGGSVRTTGPGQVLGLPAGYASTFPGEIRSLLGAHDGVLLAQQTAANLGAGVGTVVTVERPGQPPVDLTVAGIVDLPAADSLFQAIGVAPGSAPIAPPDNVMLLSDAVWRRLFAGAAGGSTATQIHAELARTLPADPGAAFAQVVGRAKNLEAALAGQGLVGDNLAAQLDGARSDAVYAELLFLFLGVPGVVLAGLLTSAVASSSRERRRREQALLRTRGASPSRILRVATVEALATGAAGVAFGLAAAALIGRLVFGATSFGATGAQALMWIMAAALGGLALSMATIVLPARQDARTLTVRGAQATIGPTRRPLWSRLYLDLVCLAAGGLIYWQAVRSGYQVVLAPEGVPTISVSTLTLLAPLLFWVGSALLTWRLASAGLARGRRLLAGLWRPAAHGLSGVVAASMSRQRRSLSRGLVLMALAASFALSVGIFNTTYAAQARVDAQLTNGADVAATTTAATGLPPNLAATVRGLPGVAAAEPMQHRFAYVGSDLQDLYGIDAATIGRATPMSNAFFSGGDARASLATLAGRPDAVLVSDETVHDFQLQARDLIRLRLQFASDHRYHVVPFHYVGIAREFPTAPHDSFLVANAAYVARVTGNAAPQTLLVRTTGSPPAVAASLRTVLGPASGATVRDIVSQRTITLSGLTAIDLAGLTRLQLVFALVMAAGASGLVLALALSERRRTFAIASALGARRSQLASFVWSEATYVAVGGLALGGVAGWGVALVIVRILTGVFDPPPEHLSIPWGYLAALGAAVAAAVAAAGLGILRATQRPAVEVVRDL
jgi:putative ABC transport system permease protein